MPETAPAAAKWPPRAAPASPLQGFPRLGFARANPRLRRDLRGLRVADPRRSGSATALRWSASASIPSRPARSRCAGSRTSWRRPVPARSAAPASCVENAGHRDLALRPAARACTSRTTGSTRSGTRSHWDGLRARLPQPVVPGEEVELAVPLLAPRPPGRYRLAFDFVEENRFWFAEVGLRPLEVETEVLPRIAERRLGVRVHGGDGRGDGCRSSRPRRSRSWTTSQRRSRISSPARSRHRTGRGGCSTRTRKAGQAVGPGLEAAKRRRKPRSGRLEARRRAQPALRRAAPAPVAARGPRAR